MDTGARSMSHEPEWIALSPSDGPAARAIPVYRFGRRGARPKVYLQGGLHAGEAPGILVLHHLMQRLAEADRAGLIPGEFVLAPACNPIGAGQFVGGCHIGRYDLASGVNFNRQLPAVGGDAVARLAGALAGSPAERVERARRALAASVADRRPALEADRLKARLLGLAIDSDIVIDCHSAGEAILHVLVWHANWPDGRDLALQLGASLALVIGDSGGGTFEEACATPWDALAVAYPDAFPVRPSFVAGIEFRGDADVTDAFARTDADNLFRFFQRRGAIAGDAGPVPAGHLRTTPMAAIDVVRAPAAGVLAVRRPVGSLLAPREVVADLIDTGPSGGAVKRIPIRTDGGGLLFSVSPQRVVARGHPVAMIAGETASDRHPWID